MTEELTPSEKLERLERFTEQTRAVVRCMRRIAGVSGEPFRFRLRELVERPLQDGGLAQRNPVGVYIEERFPRPLQSLVEAQRQRLKQKKEHEEVPVDEKTKPRKEPKEDEFDFSVVIY